MAPKRKLITEENTGASTVAATASATRVTRTAARFTARGTRSATRRGDAALNTPLDNPEPRKRKNATTAAASSSSAAAAAAAAKTVIIEHCKESSSFKTKAIQVKKGLEKGVSGVNVVVNPESPRKGYFEIRDEGGEVFVSFKDMESPFQPLKELDVKKVVSDIVEKIK